LKPSYGHYTETRQKFSLDELGFNGKLSIQGKLLPEGLDAYTDISGMIQDIVHAPSTNIPAFQYWSINLRAGYVERVAPDVPEWSFLTGWYWWRFYVVGEKFGVVPRLAGPQLFLQRRFQPVHGRTWFVNARWAFLGDRDAPQSFEDYEASLGGGVEIAWIGKRRPLSVTLDVSRLQFMKDNNSMSLFNFIAGLSFPIY
jgi:hypothetical protein